MLRINGKRLVPAPLISLAKNYTNTGDGRPLTHLTTVTLAGTILPNHGSPNSSGTFWTAATGAPGSENFITSTDKFNSLLNKQEYLKELFQQPGQLLEYAPDDGSAVVSGLISIANINFQEGQWVDRCNYTIGLEVEILNRVGSSGEVYGNFYDYHLAQASDSINITESEDGSQSINIAHSLSAVGKALYQATGVLRNNKEPWENARDWCLTQLETTFSTNVINTTGKVRYNINRTENIDRWAGSYSINQNYVIRADNQNYIHNYDVQTTTARSQIDDLDLGQSLTENITVNGTVIGLFASGNSPTGKLAIARNAFTSFVEPNIPTVANLTSNHLFVNKTIGESTTNGALSYSYNYTNFPSGSAYTHVFNVNDNKVSNGISSANIAGLIKYNTFLGSATGIFNSATGIWNSVRTGLRNVAQNIVGATLCQEPTNLTLNFNKSEASINYSATYNYADEFNSSSATYIDTYEVTLNDINAAYPITAISPNGTVSVVGSIIGLSSDGQVGTRYGNALSRWNSIKNNLIVRATGLISSTGIAPKVITRSEAYNKSNGTINYSYTFSTKLLGTAGIANEDITIDISDPRDIYAVQIIPGLATGPIIQNLGTVSEARVTVAVRFSLEPGTSLSTPNSRFDTIASPYIPATGYLENSTSNYNIYAGDYTKTKTWVYKG